MKKRLLLVIMILLLMFSMVACQKEDSKSIDNNENTTETNEENANEEADSTPEPRPTVVDVFATKNALYQVYEDGSFGYIGSPFELDDCDVDYYVDSKLQEMGIPVIVDYKDYSEGYEFDYEVIDKREVDMDDYNSKYGDTIQALKDRMHLELANEDITVREVIKESYNSLLIIYDTPDKKGLVFADTEADYSFKTDEGTTYTSTEVLSYDLFDGEPMIDVTSGDYYTLGLLEDGSVIVYYSPELVDMINNNEVEYTEEHIQIDFSDWTDVVDIVVFEYYYPIGVKNDGTIISMGIENSRYKAVSNWTDIVSIQTMDNTVIGLKNDGTVVIEGNPGDYSIDLSNWSDVKEIKSYGDTIYGLTNDGKVYYYAYDFRGYNEEIGREINYTFNELLNIENIVSIDITSNGVILLTEDGQVKHINKYGAYLYTDRYSTGIEDVLIIDNNILMVKKADSIDIVGADYTAKYPDDLDKEWDELKEKYYIEKDFANGANIFGDSQDDNVIITDDGGLILNFNSWGMVYTYEYSEKIVDVSYAAGGYNSYFIALSEGGDIIILSTFEAEDNCLYGVSEEDVVDMDNFKSFLSHNGITNILHNDGTVLVLDELSTLSFCYLSTYNDSSLEEFNTFNDTYYVASKSLSNDDSQSEHEEPADISWDEFLEFAGIELPACDDCLFEYGQDYSDNGYRGYYSYNFICEKEEDMFAYIDTLEAVDNLEMVYTYDETKTVYDTDGNEEDYESKIYEFEYNDGTIESGFDVELNYYDFGFYIDITYYID